VPDWLVDLLLEPVAPPSNWLPSRAERLADARLTLRRKFGRAREVSVRPSHHLRDFGSAHPLIGGSRVVPGDEIEAAMELEITSINPPTAQGWIVAATAVLGAVVLFMVDRIVDASASASGGRPGTNHTADSAPWIAFAAIALWALAILGAGLVERQIELDEGGVRVRRWVERWLGREGARLGPPEGIRAELETSTRLRLETADRTVFVSTRFWPHTARADLVDELPIWGVESEVGRHRHRPERPGRRRREATRRRRSGVPVEDDSALQESRPAPASADGP
jgi:hypothetical protein